MSNLGYSKHFQGVADVFMRSPSLYAPMLQFIENVMTGVSELSKAEREIIAAHVSALNDCQFCLGAHRATLKAMGTNPETIESLDAGINVIGIDQRMVAILTFATKLTQTPEHMEPTDIMALQDAGWADQTIEDVINVVALFNYVNRLVDAFGIEGNQPYFDYVGKALAADGYTPLIKQAQKKAG